MQMRHGNDGRVGVRGGLWRAALGCCCGLLVTACQPKADSSVHATAGEGASTSNAQAQAPNASGKHAAATREEQRPVEVTQTQFPDGKPQRRQEGYRDENGNFVLHGLATEWYESGQKKLELHYRDNKLNGERTAWFEDGSVRSRGSFVDNRSDGLWVEYYQDGTLAQEIRFKLGKYDGPQTQYHTNGKKKMEVSWENGVKQGVERVWDETGRELFVTPPKPPEGGGH